MLYRGWSKRSRTSMENASSQAKGKSLPDLRTDSKCFRYAFTRATTTCCSFFESIAILADSPNGSRVLGSRASSTTNLCACDERAHVRRRDTARHLTPIGIHPADNKPKVKRSQRLAVPSPVSLYRWAFAFLHQTSLCTHSWWSLLFHLLPASKNVLWRMNHNKWCIRQLIACRTPFFMATNKIATRLAPSEV